MTKKENINGNCFICGKKNTKIVMKNHIYKEHNDGTEKCYLIKAEGVYNKKYWLYFSMPLEANLSVVDKFLRQIWCECCGHLSAFYIGGEGIGKSRKLYDFDPGEKLLYEYDFGTSTDIAITIIDEISRPVQKEKISLIARNEPLKTICAHCGKNADYMNVYDMEYTCDECVGGAEYDDYLLPITNSPRSGECGYTGECDKWTFKQVIHK